MKYISLFSGIGGFELGIQRAFDNRPDLRNRHKGLPEDSTNTEKPQVRAECIGYSEIDKYAIKTYERHFNHDNYGDITTINPDTLPDFELLVGGFPCQAFSVAGKRAGFNDTRGTLFFDIARILKVKKPRHLVLENVKGLLSHDSGKTFQTILGVLTDLGYDVEWQVLNSKDFGVPQNRERVFIVGHLGNECRGKVFPIIGQGNENTTLGQSTETAVARTLTAGGHSGGNHSGMTIVQLNNPTHSNDRVYASDGIAPTLNTMQGGNRQPFIAAQRGRGNPPKQTLEPQLEDRTNSITSVAKDNLVVSIKEATKKGYAEATVGDTLNISVPTSKTRRGRVQKGMAGTLQTSESMATLTPDARIRRLTPLECERLMGYPDGWTEGQSDTQRYKQCGNGVVSNVVEAVMERLFEHT